MDRVRYHALVGRYAELAERSPLKFRRRLRALVIAALAYLTLSVAVLAAAASACLVAMERGRGVGVLAIATFVCAVGIGAVLRGLFLRVEAPGGHLLRRDDAPGLFRMIDALRSRMRVGSLAKVWVDGEFNASAVQRPWLGLFGFSRHHLVLGLPLLAALRPDELRAILAHELAHFERDHGRFGRWLYRFQHSWQELGAAGLPGVLLLPFDAVLGPHLAAATSVHAREQELEADRRSAELVGAEANARAGARIYAVSGQLENDFGESFRRATATNSEPPPDVHTRGVTFIRGLQLRGARSQRLLRTAFGEATDWDDTHPPLFERLRALGIVERNASPESAIETVLQLSPDTDEPDALSALVADPDALVAIADAAWREEASCWWASFRARALEARERLDALEARAAGDGAPIGGDEAWERVLLASEQEPTDRARALLEAFLEQDPDHADACWQLSGHLYDEADPRCLEWAERAAERDPAFRAGLTALRQQWLREQGERGQAAALQDDLLREFDCLDRVVEERGGVSENDRFGPHDLAPTLAERLATQLRRAGGISRAWLVRRELEHLPERPQYLIVIEPESRAWWRFHSEEYEARQLERIARELHLPFEWLSISHAALGWRARRRLRRTPRAALRLGEAPRRETLETAVPSRS